MSGCSTSTKKLSTLNPHHKYEELLPDLQMLDSFAFATGGHEYYFASTYVEDNGYKCYFYLGFKDQALTYKFPAQQLIALKSIYEGRMSIDEKMQKALKKIEELSNQKYACDAGVGQKQESELSQTFSFLFYGSVKMISIPFGGAQKLIEGYEYDAFADLLKGVRLGMNPGKVHWTIGKNPSELKAPPYVIEHLVQERHNLAFFYKDDKLIAFVFGH